MRLTVIFDSCHSGTALDLPYVYDSGGNIVCSPEMIAAAAGPKPTAQASNTTYYSSGAPYGSTYYSSMPAATTYYQSNPTVQYHARKKKKWTSTDRLGYKRDGSPDLTTNLHFHSQAGPHAHGRFQFDDDGPEGHGRLWRRDYRPRIQLPGPPWQNLSGNPPAIDSFGS